MVVTGRWTGNVEVQGVGRCVIKGGGENTCLSRRHEPTAITAAQHPVCIITLTSLHPLLQTHGAGLQKAVLTEHVTSLWAQRS